MTPKRDTRRIHRAEAGGAPFNTSNTETDSKHTDSKHTDGKHTDSKNTDKQHAGNTNNRQKRHPRHAIRASAVADIYSDVLPDECYST